eukprot:s1603_g12.t1
MSGSKDDSNSRPNLETFSGEDSSEYRRWRRKAELYLMGLPTTVPESKWGARLVEHLRGEAEELMEHVELSTITSDKGYQKVFELLDERYKELDKDELQRCLKSYFYAAPIKNQETYRNFVIRMDTAYRGLTRHKVELPEPVRGWILLKKLLLDSTSEALIMTSTAGSLKYTDVLAALKAVFPNGQGPGVSQGRTKDKEIFIAQEGMDPRQEPEEVEVQAHDDALEVMEAIANQTQEQSDYESEDALEVFENYSSIRRKMQEKKTSRGFRQVNTTEKQWKLEGSVQGKLSLLKAKTRCHHCRRLGHWKKECPMKQGGDKSKKSDNSNSQKEVHIVEGLSDDDAFFESYVMDEPQGKAYESEELTYQETEVKEKKETQPKAMKEERSKKTKDVWNLDRDHGVLERIHHRARKGLFTPHGVKDIPVPMEQLSGDRETILINVETEDTNVTKDNFHTARVPHQKMDYVWHGKTKFYLKNTSQSEKPSASTKVVDPDAQVEQYELDVLSAIHEGAKPDFSNAEQAASLDSHAVPDTACRRTLIGDYVLSLLESRLNEKGLIVTRRREDNEFRFGNAGVLKSSEVASIPVTIGDRHVVVHAAVLPEPGSRTPFLFSKELLKCLESVLDTSTDEMIFKRINQRVKMGKTERGHYAIPILPQEHIYKKPSAELVNGLILENKMDMTSEEIDRYSDHSEDEPEKPVNGQELMKAGKYKNTNTMDYAYTKDKKHLKWVRSNVQPQGSSPEMRRYRLYVEMRDQKKIQRINQNMDYQCPVVPKPKGQPASKMTPKAKAKQVMREPPLRSRRREREGEGWSHEMSATEMEYEEDKTWAFLEEMEQAENEEQMSKMWHEIVMTVAEKEPEKAQQMIQVSEIMGIRKAWTMFKAVEEK